MNMGHFSVYCSASKITIGSGDEVVLLPIHKNPIDYRREGRNEYVPYALPIFGTYDSYGGIEAIEEDFNTKLIEQTHGCPIQEFCNFLTDFRKDYQDDDSEWFGKENLKILEKVSYIWFRRDVWNFLSTYHPYNAYGRAGSIDMGDHNVLTKLGFTFEGKVEKERYNKLYTWNRWNVYSDGRWLNSLTSPDGTIYQGIYSPETLNKHTGIDIEWFKGKEKQHLYEIYPIIEERLMLLYTGIGLDYMDADSYTMLELISKVNPEYVEERSNRYPSITHQYASRLLDNDLCSRIADVITVMWNMWIYSTVLEPFKPLITIQDGEYSAHQNILDKFAAINRSIVKTYSDEEDDE